MTASTLPPRSHQDAAPNAQECPDNDWWERHKEAMQHPETHFERALLQLLHGWINYNIAHQCAYGCSVQSMFDPYHQDDDPAYAGWSRIGTGLLCLLKGKLDRLDARALGSAIRGLLEPVGEGAGNLLPTANNILLQTCTLSRAYRLKSGALIDVSAVAREVGFWEDVAVSSALWADIHAIPARLQGRTDPQSRLRQILLAAKEKPRARDGLQSIGYCSVAMPVGETTWHTVQIIHGDGDRGESVFTLQYSTSVDNAPDVP